MGKGLTSLAGINFIKDTHRISGLYLRDNFILGNDQDPDFSLNAFLQFPKLTDLDLSKNEIKNLPENIFQGPKQLKLLFLSGNKLKKLPVNIFKGLSSLQWLLLDGNDIDLPEENMRKLHQLSSSLKVYLNGSGNEASIL